VVVDSLILGSMIHTTLVTGSGNQFPNLTGMKAKDALQRHLKPCCMVGVGEPPSVSTLTVANMDIW